MRSSTSDKYRYVGMAAGIGQPVLDKGLPMLARLSGLIVACFGRFLVLQTTSEVFTRISPDNSLERLTECGVGLVTDQSSDFWELFVTPFK
jgi:hypothetical protein